MESIAISGAPQPPLLSGAWLQGTAATLRRLELHSTDLVDLTVPLPNLRSLSISRSSFSALCGLSLADMTPNLEELYVHGWTLGAHPEPRCRVASERSEGGMPAASRLPPSLGVLACHATDLPGMLAGMAASTSLRTLAVQACSFRQTLQAGAALSSLIAPGGPTSPSASRLLGDLTTLSICPEGWQSSDLRAHDLGHHDYVVAESAGEDLPPEHVAAWRSLMNDVPMRRLEVLNIVLFDGQVAPSGCADSLRSLTLYADALPDADTLMHRVAVRAPSIEHFWVHAPTSLFMSRRTADMLASLPEFGRRCAQLRLFRLPVAMMSSKQDRDRLEELTLELRLKDKADREAWGRVREQLVAYKTWAMHSALQRLKASWSRGFPFAPLGGPASAAKPAGWTPSEAKGSGESANAFAIPAGSDPFGVTLGVLPGTVPEARREGAGRRTAITSVPWHYASLGERVMAYLGPAKSQERFEIATNYWPQRTTTLQARRR